MTKQKSEENLIPNTPSLKKQALLKNLSQKLQKNTKFRRIEVEAWILRGPWITPKLVVTSDFG